MPLNTLIVIVGPTAIGKTALAIELAQMYSTEIISTDSRQFFKEMAIGTAKPSAEELSTVKHHFIDSHSVQDFFSTGDFEIEALKSLERLFEKHKVVVAVGGSGLYVNALCNGLDELPEIDLSVREELNRRLETKGIDSIRQELEKVDPIYFDKVDTNNPQRMIRGLEMFLSNGITLSSLLTKEKKVRPFNIVKIGLNMDRAALYERINNRVDKMIQSGLIQEVQSLQHFKHLNALRTVGYSEIFNYLDGIVPLEEAISKIKQNTRRFAKRQLTWFNKDMEIKWYEPSQINCIKEFLSQKIS